jgi:hypothetical protein
VRLWSFARGLITYLILEDQQRVDVIDVVRPADGQPAGPRKPWRAEASSMPTSSP